MKRVFRARQITLAELKATKLRNNQAVIECANGYTFQFTTDSREAMQDLIGELAVNAETAEWRLLDNTSVTVNAEKLQAFYDECRSRKARRSVMIDAEYVAFKADLPSITVLLKWEAKYAMGFIPMLRLCRYENFSEWIEPKIVEIARRAQWPTLLTEVQTAFERGSASLFVAEDGFVILTPTLLNDAKAVHVWVVWSRGQNTIERYFAELVMLAKDVEAKAITFWSVRRGFERVAPKYGWQKSHTEQQFTVWVKTL